MTLVPDTEFLNPLEFPGDTSVFCSNEVTLGGPWMGAGHQKDQAMLRSLELSASHTLFREGEGLEMELIIGDPYLRKPP